MCLRRFVEAAFHDKAIDLNGSNEYLANSSYNTVGFGNAFTISIRFKPNYTSNATGYQPIFDCVDSSNNNRVNITANGTGKFLRDIYQNSSNKIRKHTTNDTLTLQAKNNAILTYASGSSKVYINGTEITALSDRGSSGSVTMGTNARKVYIGAYYTPQASILAWIISKVDIRSSQLSATEVTALYDSGNGYQLDVQNSKGNYTSTADLVQQWALGKDDTDIGKSYVTSGAIDVDTNAANISSADIVTF